MVLSGSKSMGNHYHQDSQSHAVSSGVPSRRTVHTMACEPCGSCKHLVSQTVRKYCLLFYIIKRAAIRDSSNKKQKSRKEGFCDDALRATKKTQPDMMTFWCAEKDIWEIIRRERRNPGNGLSPERK